MVCRYPPRRILFALLLTFAVLLSLSAEHQPLGGFGSFVDLPDGWQLIGEEPEKLTFASADQGAYLQLKLFPSVRNLGELVSVAEERLKAEGEGTVYAYGGGEAYFGTLSFESGGFSFSGYLFAYFALGLPGRVVLAFSNAESLAVYNDQILSGLDSYSPQNGTDRLPGPVGAFDRLFSAGSPVPVAVGPKREAAEIDRGEIETAVYVTEREVRILAAAGTTAAWRRFFRILYRDSLAGIEPVIAFLHERYPSRPTPAESREIAEELLVWLQGFAYRRSGTLSDFLDPVQALVASAGDCDSLGLLYVMLLHSFGIDAILLVSEQYSHALGAVDLPGEGARFTVGEKRYMVAELTDDVALGLIASDMADPAGWIPVVFPPTIWARSGGGIP